MDYACTRTRLREYRHSIARASEPFVTRLGLLYVQHAATEPNNRGPTPALGLRRLYEKLSHAPTHAALSTQHPTPDTRTHGCKTVDAATPIMASSHGIWPGMLTGPWQSYALIDGGDSRDAEGIPYSHAFTQHVQDYLTRVCLPCTESIKLRRD